MNSGTARLSRNRVVTGSGFDMSFAGCWLAINFTGFGNKD